MDVDLLLRIRQERRRRGWSMRAAAAAAGVSNTTWSRMEAGAVEITPAMSRHIADAFGWPDDWETNPDLAGTLSHPAVTLDPEELLARTIYGRVPAAVEQPVLTRTAPECPGRKRKQAPPTR